MDIKVQGKQVLSGEITPSGSKNSAVALLPASILFDGVVTYENIPEITDVDRLINILEKLGSTITWDKKTATMKIDNTGLSVSNLDSKDLGNMRGTSLLWGPMLARFGTLEFKDLPGGCTLGVRPLDTHYLAFKDLGVKVTDERNSVHMDATQAKARKIWLHEMSPTATENVIMLATSLEGTTTIVGAASEPQVQDLCEFLIQCGADISGVGSSIVVVNGGKTLTPVTHRLYSDHYEITTFLALAAATGGEIKIHNAMPEKLVNIMNVFAKFGVHVEYEGDTAIVKKGQQLSLSQWSDKRLLTVKAQPWPGLPVDTLPLFIPLALAANDGQVLFHNWMYEAGLFWTSELLKLGGNIIMGDPHRVVVTAGSPLSGAKLEAPYIIRAVVALVMAAMVAEGESIILDADALYRGHPHFAENLKKLGAKIEILEESSR